MRSLSIGICAYNEERNIGRLLENLLDQPLSEGYRLSEILVVASGCEDKTEDIVKGFAERDGRVRLISEEVRKGKVSAVNRILESASGDIIVFVCADNLPEKGSIDRLVKPFVDGDVGATAGRPVPVNNPEKFTGFMTHLIWSIHHDVSSIQAKLTGELCAVRNGVVDGMPADIVNDDAALEVAIRNRGLRIVYVPEAVTYMRGPDSIRGLVVQRRRVAGGYLQMRGDTWNLSTYHMDYVLRGMFREFKRDPGKFAHLVVASSVELLSRLLASRDAMSGKLSCVWDVVESTKRMAE